MIAGTQTWREREKKLRAPEPERALCELCKRMVLKRPQGELWIERTWWNASGPQQT